MRRQADEPPQRMQNPLPLEPLEVHVIVALFAINEGGKGFVPLRGGHLCLGGGDPSRRVGPPSPALSPGRRVPLLGEPSPEKVGAGGSPNSVDEGQEADGPLLEGSGVPLFGDKGDNGPP